MFSMSFLEGLTLLNPKYIESANYKNLEIYNWYQLFLKFILFQ